MINQRKPFAAPYTDPLAQKQAEILGSKSAWHKIKPAYRLFFLALVTAIMVAAIWFPVSVGLPLFFAGMLNYLTLISFRISNNIGRASRRSEHSSGAEAGWPLYSIIIPLKQEGEVVRGTIRAVEDLVYPDHLKQVLIVVEETDRLTLDTLKRIELPPYAAVVVIPENPPFTKGRALLHALQAAKGDYVTIYDAESRPEPEQLQKAARVLAGSDGLVCLQARISISNKDSNWITRNFAGEYYEWYERHLQYLSAEGHPFGLGGNSFFVGRDVLQRACAWDPFNVTEDADLTVRLVESGVRFRMLDSETTETCPENTREWTNQRTRWNKGLFITQLVHFARTLRMRHFSADGWVNFWLPMACSSLVPFFNLFIPVLFVSGRLPYHWQFLLSVGLWSLLVVNLISSTLINKLTYTRLGIRAGWVQAFFDSVAYMFLHIGAGFKAYGEYFWSPLHWHKTAHQETGEPAHFATVQPVEVPINQLFNKIRY
ncbi:MAG: glycosyltransferase [Saprospiraceae bacterium]|nr:glycosyltransferase [Saprospiraceae bacterium]